MSSNKLEKLRRSVDGIDGKILGLLNDRSSVVLKIGKLKEQSHEEVYSPLREKLLLEGLTKRNRGPFPAHALRAVFSEILSASRAIQAPLKVSYLGPAATFTHLAAIKHFGRSTDFVPVPSISKVFDSVEHGHSSCGVVPIENSTEGVVGATLDRFLDSPLKILGEIALPVSHHLLSRNGNLRSVQKIYSHTQAAAQCRQWLDENLPNVPVIDVESTSRAAERAAEELRSAGIAGEQAAELYGLKILKRDIEDNPNNVTRFLAIGRKSPSRSGRDKTSILFSVKDEAGILYRMLEPFYRNKINLTKIESRPLKKKVWEYVFFLDMDGHIEDRKVGEAIRCLEGHCLFVKVLGSYPKATG